MKLTAEEKIQFMARLSTLRNEQSEWRQHWQEIADNVRPRAFRYLQSDRAQAGRKKNRQIYNTTPTHASRTLAAGMMAGITSPSRPWFRLSTPDLAVAESMQVKEWLSTVEDRIRQIFAKSNIYNVLHMLYQDLGDFGTSAMLLEKDEKDILRGYHLPIGSYCLIPSERQDITGIYRESQLTVANLVKKFGMKGEYGVSDQVKLMWENQQYDTWIPVTHLICPNDQYLKGKLGVRGMEYVSVWYESNNTTPERYLRLGGFKSFPVMAPRWSTIGEDIYGNSPGMEALGDCIALQLMEKRKMQVVDKITDPPMRGPSSLEGRRASILPGDVTYVDSLTPNQTFAPAMEIQPAAVSVIGGEIQEEERRIKSAYYADLWLMLSQSDGQMTAREVVERREEKMLQLGTVLERVQDELLSPMLERTFEIMYEAGQIPPPPEELQGTALRVEYISIMAQAQKLLGTTGIERFTTFAGNLAAVVPSILDKVDFDEGIDKYADMLGVPPSMVRTTEVVQQMRQQQQQARQQQQQMDQAQQLAKTGKDLSNADTEGPNALTSMLRGLGAA